MCSVILTFAGSIEQAILSHEGIGEAAVVGIPDEMKGQLPFAFVQPSTTASSSSSEIPATPSKEFFDEINSRVRQQVGGIASLGGVIQGRGMIPKTRSGKTLRRCLRELLENASNGEFDKEISIPATVEDRAVVDVARERVREYFEQRKKDTGKAKL